MVGLTAIRFLSTGAHRAVLLPAHCDSEAEMCDALSKALRLGGALPCNTSGGQLSESHCEGMLQIVEGVRQMRHTYPKHRQVKDAEIALISGHGGNQVCHSTLILGRA